MRRADSVAPVIAAAAFCPHPPALVPELGRGGASDFAPVRDACRAAVAHVGQRARRLAVIGSAATSAVHSPVAQGNLASFGVPVDVRLGSPACGGTLELPLSLTIGAWLAESVLGPRSGAVGFSVGPGFAADRA